MGSGGPRGSSCHTCKRGVAQRAEIQHLQQWCMTKALRCMWKLSKLGIPMLNATDSLLG